MMRICYAAHHEETRIAFQVGSLLYLHDILVYEPFRMFDAELLTDALLILIEN